MTPVNSELRLAIVATPRGGNTWLRLLLSDLLDVQPLAVHDPDDCPWDNLPPRFSLTVHWHRTRAFEELLARHSFRIIGIHRHPLDTLISILHLSHHDVQYEWLRGEGGSEDCIVGAMPLSRASYKYGASRRAAALLKVNLEWFGHPARYELCYEHLVERTEDELTGLFDWLGEAPRRSVRDVMAERSLSANQKNFAAHSHFFWKGQPGLWRSLLCRVQPELLAQAHWQSFARFGYLCDPDLDLTAAQADANWIKLVREDHKRAAAEVIASRAEMANIQAERKSLQDQVDRLTEENRKLAGSPAAHGPAETQPIDRLGRCA